MSGNGLRFGQIPFGSRQKTEFMLKPINAGRVEAIVGSSERTLSVRWALVSLSLSMLLSSLGTSIANVGLPTLAQVFHHLLPGSPVGRPRLSACHHHPDRQRRTARRHHRPPAAAAGRNLPVHGGLDRLRRRARAWLLLGARAAQGLGVAIMTALTMALVGETVPKARTGSAMGLLGTMSAIGTALGPSLGGLLIAGLGWRAIFFVKVPLGILAFLLAHRHLPADRRGPTTERTGFDHVGTLLLALTLAAYALAMTIGRGRFGPLNAALLLAAVLGIGLFALAEARAASPLLRLAMFRERALSASLATSALVSTVMMATLVVGPFYLSRALGLEAAMVGIVMSIGPPSPR